MYEKMDVKSALRREETACKSLKERVRYKHEKNAFKKKLSLFFLLENLSHSWAVKKTPHNKTDGFKLPAKRKGRNYQKQMKFKT